LDGRQYGKEIVPTDDRTRMGGRDHTSGMGFQLHASERIQVVHSADASSDRSGKIGEAVSRHCNRAIAASVIAVIPVRRVGSGNGAKNGECGEGSATPVRSLSTTFAGSYAPSQKITAGIL
jgi:hypothetical protein